MMLTIVTMKAETFQSKYGNGFLYSQANQGLISEWQGHI